jgi:hypothetical protein
VARFQAAPVPRRGRHGSEARGGPSAVAAKAGRRCCEARPMLLRALVAGATDKGCRCSLELQAKTTDATKAGRRCTMVHRHTYHGHRRLLQATTMLVLSNIATRKHRRCCEDARLATAATRGH